MKCSSGCKYFVTRAFSGSGYPTINHSTIHGNCNKYAISTSTDEECLDTLPYTEK